MAVQTCSIYPINLRSRAIFQQRSAIDRLMRLMLSPTSEENLHALETTTTLNASIVLYRQRKPVEKGAEKVRMFVGGEAAPVTWKYAEVCRACSAWKISGVNIQRDTELSLHTDTSIMSR